MTYLDQELLEARESEQPAPYEKLEAKEASGFLLRILATLPPRQQEVLQLKFQNDLSYQEISEITSSRSATWACSSTTRSKLCGSVTGRPPGISCPSPLESSHENKPR